MSDISQGEGWWMASDHKWYPPELHPDYIATENATVQNAAAGSTPGDQHAAAGSTPGDQHAAAGSTPGESPDTSATNSAQGHLSEHVTRDYLSEHVTEDLDGDKQAAAGSSTTTKLLIGAAIAGILAIVTFIGFRFFGGTETGADSPEAAVEQFLESVHSLDVAGIANSLHPGEQEAWNNGIFSASARAVNDLTMTLPNTPAQEPTGSEELDKLIELLDVQIDSGNKGEPIKFTSEFLDEKERMARVSIDSAHIRISVDEEHPIANDRALIFSQQGKSYGLNLSEYRDTTAEVIIDSAKETIDLNFTSGGKTNSETLNVSAPNLITVQENGRWYISPGYTAFEMGNDYVDFGKAHYGTALDLIESQTGGAESAEKAVDSFFDALDSLDLQEIIDLTDPVSFPYLHDYAAPVRDEIEVWTGDLSAISDSVHLETKVAGTTEFNGRTVVQISSITASMSDGSNMLYSIDLERHCIDMSDGQNSDEMCYIEELAREMKLTSQELREALPNHFGIAAVERNGRWFIDVLATSGYTVELYLESVEKLPQRVLEADNFYDAAALEETVITTGPFATKPGVYEAKPVNSIAGIAFDIDDFTEIEIDTDSYSPGAYNVALVRAESSTGVKHINDNNPVTPSLALVSAKRTSVSAEEFLAASAIVKSDSTVNFEIEEMPLLVLSDETPGTTFDSSGTPILVYSSYNEGLNYQIDGSELALVSVELDSHKLKWLETPKAQTEPIVAAHGNTYLLWGEPGSEFSVTRAGRFNGPDVASVEIIGAPLPLLETPENDRAVGMRAPGFFASSMLDSEITMVGEGTNWILIFTSHWCSGCQSSLDEISRNLSSVVYDDSFEVILISTAVDETKPNYPPTQWLDNINWPVRAVADDERSNILHNYGLYSLPTIVAVDANGIVRSRGLTLEEAVASLSAETTDTDTGNTADTYETTGTKDGQYYELDPSARPKTLALLQELDSRNEQMEFYYSSSGGYFDGCDNGPNEPQANGYHFLVNALTDARFILVEYPGSGAAALEEHKTLLGSCNDEADLTINANVERPLDTGDPERVLDGIVITYSWDDEEDIFYYEYYVAEGGYLYITDGVSEEEATSNMAALVSEPLPVD